MLRRKKKWQMNVTSPEKDYVYTHGGQFYVGERQKVDENTG